MKKVFMFALAAATMASCSNDEFLGEGQGHAQNETGAILFSAGGAQGAHKGVKRMAGDHVGADAAAKLNNNFVVAGYKGGTLSSIGSVVTNTVFDHYNVVWAANTAGTTASNTSDWEYVDKDKSIWNTSITDPNKQEIKYWDYSVGQYDFIAYSTSDFAAANIVKGTDYATGKLTISPVTPANAKNSATGAYTVAGDKDDLAKFYIADLVTAYNSANTAKVADKPVMGDEVKLTFRNLTSKVRFAFYETVPGYSIKDVKFYQNGSTPYQVNSTDAVPGAVPTLYAADANFYTSGKYAVYYPTVDNGTPASDYNKAHVKFTAAGTQSTTFADGTALNYTRTQASTKESNGKYLGETSSTATYATSGKHYTIALPNESSSSLTLRVDYTLVSNDGSGETIVVKGATAQVPAIYAQWKSNYAYTYIFKISDKTNGTTQGLGVGPEGLTPITFDAVVTETEDGIQETITTVAAPSITTYSEGVQPTENNEYLTSKDVYVMVQDGATLKGDLDTKGKLYTVRKTGKAEISEATVMDALNMNDGATPLVGRNGIELTASTAYAAVTQIPGVDGNMIGVTEKTAFKFTTGTAGTVYAYVYDYTTSATPKDIFSAETLAAEATKPSDWDTMWFTDPEGHDTVTWSDDCKGKTFYHKYVNAGNSYAVKVIRVKE